MKKIRLLSAYIRPLVSKLSAFTAITPYPWCPGWLFQASAHDTVTIDPLLNVTKT
jgi:hypothetical protein